MYLPRGRTLQALSTDTFLELDNFPKTNFADCE